MHHRHGSHLWGSAFFFGVLHPHSVGVWLGPRRRGHDAFAEHPDLRVHGSCGRILFQSLAAQGHHACGSLGSRPGHSRVRLRFGIAPFLYLIWNPDALGNRFLRLADLRSLFDELVLQKKGIGFGLRADGRRVEYGLRHVCGIRH